MNRPSEFQILVSDDGGHGEANLQKLADFAGIATQVTTLDTFMASGLSDPELTGPRCLGLSARTLGRLTDRLQLPPIELRAVLADCGFTYLYIYGFCKDEVSQHALGGLVDAPRNAIVGFERDAHCYSVTASRNTLTAELAGITFGPVSSAVDYAFTPGATCVGEPLICIDDCPHFTMIEETNCTIFLHALATHFDIHAPAPSKDLARSFSQFAPLFMFLRFAFGEQCWHSARLQANLIIDDPYLRPHYGFVDMAKLIDSMDCHNYATTIAFIPWNYRRTAACTSRLFRERADRLSICVHGCDHIGGEFGARDGALLRSRIRTASTRMRKHRQTTGVPCEKVIVFPQGVFSTPAMQALKQENYIAAVNSGPSAVDAAALDLTYGELLDVAVMAYSSFPLFSRRYPSEDMVAFRIDAFLNKPLLAVEHHQFFRNGFEQAASFATKINAISTRLQWRGVSDVLLRTYLQRCSPDGAMSYRIYGNRAIIDNPSDAPRNVRITKKENEPQHVDSVSVDGERVEFRFSDNYLEFRVDIESGEAKTIKISYACPDTCMAVPRETRSWRARVWARRRLSDFRDNYISKSQSLLALANILKRMIVR